MKPQRLADRGNPRSRFSSRVLRIEQLESRQLLSIANGVDYQFEVVAKAQPDEWFTEIGGPIVPITDPQPTGAVAKVNQDYVWGMTQSGNFIWYSTSGNVLAQASGAIGGQGGTPYQNSIRVNEYAQSQYPGVADAYRPYFGDWRPPKLYKYDMVNQVDTPLEINDPLLNQTLGIRSAGANDTIVLFAGPDLSYLGMNVFAFNAQTGAYIGSQHIGTYTSIRNWVNYNNQLYTGVSRTYSATGEGSVLRWTGSLTSPFSFTEVGRLNAEAATLCVHNGRLYAGTWPLGYGSLLAILGYRSNAQAGIWMSPALGTAGLSSSSLNSWQNIWSMTNYEPDAVIAKSVGIGAMASYDGYLVWGTMQVPATGPVVLSEAYPDVVWSQVSGAMDPVYGPSGSERPLAIFRGRNFDTTPEVQLLYGDGKLWSYVPGANPAADPGTWQLTSNNMGGNDGIYGRAGFGDKDNYYTWSAAVQRNPITNKDELYIGTFDVSPTLIGDIYTGLQGDEGLINTYDWVHLAWPTSLGADLWVFDDMNGPAEAASLNGLGNPLNHGIRTMEATPYGLFLGSASASNLLAAPYNPPTQPLKAGGAELIHMTISAAAPIQFTSTPVAEMSPVGTVVGTFSMGVSGTYTYTLLDNAGGRFQIVGNQLQVASSSLLNYETIYQPTITVQATSGSTTYLRPFTVYLTNVNEQPTSIRFSSSFTGIPENTPTGTQVTRLSTTDPDYALDTYTYELLDNAGGRFSLTDRYLFVADGALLDYETSPNPSIVVKVTDSGGLTYQKTLTVPVTNVNEAPTAVNLDDTEVVEQSATGTVVGNLSTADPDVGDTHTYVLLTDTGGRFAISGSQLVVANGTLLNKGETYEIQVQSTDAGALSVTSTLTITVTDAFSPVSLGPVDQLTLADLNPSAGDLWYRLQTTRRGWLTVDVPGAADVQLQLLDDNLIPIDVPGATATRLDYQAPGAGEILLVRLSGSATNVTLRITNLVDRQASVVNVYGTAGADNFSFDASAGVQVKVNDVAYAFTAGELTEIDFRGTGLDAAVLQGSAQTETVRIWPNQARLILGTLSVWAYGPGTITAHSGGGGDTVRLFDSTGKDIFTGTPLMASMAGNSFSNSAEGFRYVYGDASGGGGDEAHLTGSTAKDTLQANPTSAILSASTYTLQALKFRYVTVDGSQGTTDTATLTGSAGADQLDASVQSARLFDLAGTYDVSATLFEVVRVNDAGGSDVANLHDSPQNDTLVASSTQATFTGPAGSWLNIVASGFETVVANSTAGGADTATLYDTSGDDKFTVNPTNVTMVPKTGTAYSLVANDFRYAHGLATGGGVDDAYLYDSAGKDTYRADGAQGRMYYASGAVVRARYFDSFYTYSLAGGRDLAILNGTTGSETFYGTPTVSRLYGSGYYHRVVQYEDVEAYGNGGTNTANLTDSAGNDYLEASGTRAKLSGPNNSYTILVDGFNPVNARSSNVGDRKHVEAGVDFLIATGYWEDV